MTKLLDKAILRARELPEELQDEVAQLVLGFVDEEPTRLLTPEQEAEVELALKEMDEGIFATDEEMADLWKKCGL